jgi:hypothetical protein
LFHLFLSYHIFLVVRVAHYGEEAAGWNNSQEFRVQFPAGSEILSSPCPDWLCPVGARSSFLRGEEIGV